MKNMRGRSQALKLLSNEIENTISTILEILSQHILVQLNYHKSEKSFREINAGRSNFAAIACEILSAANLQICNY